MFCCWLHGPVVLRTISLGFMITRSGSRSGCSSLLSMRSAAVSPISSPCWLIVVSWISYSEAMGISSKLIRDRSSGIERPAFLHPSINPRDVMSFTDTMPEGRSDRARKLRASFCPVSSLRSLCQMNSLRTGRL